MISSQMVKEGQKLSHHALESYINELTQDSSLFQYSSILDHPQIKTVSPAYIDLIKLFSYGTLETHKNNYKGVKLNPKQLQQLKRLTVLSLFQGQQSMRVNVLGQKIAQTKNGLFKLLVQMNTKGLINAKVDEKKGVLQILWARHREIQDKKVSENVSEAKLELIYKKNEKVINQLKNIQDQKKKKIKVWDM